MTEVYLKEPALQLSVKDKAVVRVVFYSPVFGPRSVDRKPLRKYKQRIENNNDNNNNKKPPRDGRPLEFLFSPFRSEVKRFECGNTCRFYPVV